MKEHPPAPRIDQRIARHIIGIAARLWLRLYGRWQIIGIDNVPKTGGVLLAGNHASYVDPLLGWAAMYGYRRFSGVAKAELWDNSKLAYFMDAIESIKVNRSRADRAMVRTVLQRLKKGLAVGIFPEGTRTHDGKLNMGQPGIGMLVHMSNVPVVPVAMIGTFEMLPRGAKKLKRVPLKIVFGQPIKFDPGVSRERIAADVMAAIAALMTENGVPMEAPTAERAAIAGAIDD